MWVGPFILGSFKATCVYVLCMYVCIFSLRCYLQHVPSRALSELPRLKGSSAKSGLSPTIIGVLGTLNQK